MDRDEEDRGEWEVDEEEEDEEEKDEEEKDEEEQDNCHGSVRSSRHHLQQKAWSLNQPPRVSTTPAARWRAAMCGRVFRPCAESQSQSREKERRGKHETSPNHFCSVLWPLFQIFVEKLLRTEPKQLRPHRLVSIAKLQSQCRKTIPRL